MEKLFRMTYLRKCIIRPSHLIKITLKGEKTLDVFKENNMMRLVIVVGSLGL